MTTTQTTTHRVVAATHDGRYVTVPQLVGLEWHAACSAWNTLDDARRADRLPLVSYLVIRQDNDPDTRWRLGSETTWVSAVAPPARGQATYDLAPLVVGRQRGSVQRGRALRAFGKAHGYVGLQGGWIFRRSTLDREIANPEHHGRPVCQGWGAFGTLVAGRHATVAYDGRHYYNDLAALATAETASATA